MANITLNQKIHYLVEEFTVNYVNALKLDSRLTDRDKYKSFQIAQTILSQHIDKHALRSSDSRFKRLHLEHGLTPIKVFLIYQDTLLSTVKKINPAKYFARDLQIRLPAISSSE